MYLNNLDLCYNPLQERKYYRLQVVYKLPMLRLLDGASLSGQEVVLAESLYGLDVEEKYNIFKQHLPEEEFIDRRIHKSELVEAETDSEAENNNLVDEYDEDGKKTISVGKNSRFGNSKRSGFSKGSKYSKRSSFSKP
jgi:protein phosphatase 1 regulatory subunit 7